jgi:hypothetical protein
MNLLVFCACSKSKDKNPQYSMETPKPVSTGKGGYEVVLDVRAM